jgi:predicted transcriptional regulator of viral defense system
MARTPLRRLAALLKNLADAEHYLFALDDLTPMFPEASRPALKMLLSRAVADGLLEHPCRGVYLYPRAHYPRGLVLYHIAAKLRAGTFTYISLESALSDAGVISQMPVQWITIVTGGRSATIPCGRFGTIEYIHTARALEQIAPQLTFDQRCRLWRASVPLAIQDMKRCRRPMDLIDWSVANEFT